jgi:hypothetical protein
MKPIINSASKLEKKWPRTVSSRHLTTCLFSAAFLFGALQVLAHPLPPTYIPQTKFNAGQDVVPTFDGWLRNSDGSFTMVFGYMNRNYKEELVIPAGADNKVEPGTAVDQGQPTYFLPRRHAWVFQAKVPKDWGQQELVWTITVHGRTEKAYATLRMEEEIIPRLIMSRGNLSPGLDDPNQPPSISIPSTERAAAGGALTLTALVTDDGLPKPRVPKARPASEPGKAQTNSASERPRLGLNVTWFEYRGPAKVTFDPADPILVADGKAVTAARFEQPGVYVLRATANDGALSTSADVTITVSPSPGSGASR